MMTREGQFAERLTNLERELDRLLASPVIRFDDGCRSSLPETHGVYRIFDPAKPEVTLRAGRTTTAADGLRQRVYQNHLMGDQSGNLCPQLVAAGLFEDRAAAKCYVRSQLAFQYLLVPDSDERMWLECFMLSVLRPML